MPSILIDIVVDKGGNIFAIASVYPAPGAGDTFVNVMAVSKKPNIPADIFGFVLYISEWCGSGVR